MKGYTAFAFLLPCMVSAQEVPIWSVASAPAIRIGAARNDVSYQLHRVAGVIWRGSAGLVIANGGDELRFYDSNGRHRITVGRPGDGPGEFRSLDWVGALADGSVAVYDARLQHVSIFSNEGRHLRSFVLNRSDFGVAPRVVGIVGTRVLTLWWIRPEIPSGGGISQMMVRLVLYGTQEESPRVLGVGVGGEVFLHNVPGRGNFIRKAPFSPVPLYDARGGHIYNTDGVSYAVHVRDTLGNHVVTIGDTLRRIPITDVVKNAFLRDTLRFWPTQDHQRIEAAFRAMMVHQYFPMVADMRIDDEGNVWLRERRPSGALSYWDAYNAAGSLVAHVQLPPHRAILDIAHGSVVLLQRGAFDEDLVSVYTLERGTRR